MRPIRIQRKRTKGWKMVSPNGLPVVYVGRPTSWGNPFVIGDAVEAFRSLISSPDWPDNDRLPELRGKNLACWCPIDKSCHADVLLELANAPTNEK